MKLHTKNAALLFFVLHASLMHAAAQPAKIVKNNNKSTKTTGIVKKTSDVSHDDINNLINNFVTSVDLLDPKNEKNFETLSVRAQKSLTRIKKYIAQHPDKISKEQLDTLNTAIKKMPKMLPNVTQALDQIISSLQAVSTQNPQNMQKDVTKVQDLIKQLQQEVAKNPNIVTSKEQKKAIEDALKKLPQRSKELDSLLTKFKAAIDAIPEKTAGNFNSAVMNAVTADQKILNYLKTIKPIVTQDQGKLITSLTQKFKAKLPATATNAQVAKIK